MNQLVVALWDLFGENQFPQSSFGLCYQDSNRGERCWEFKSHRFSAGWETTQPGPWAKMHCQAHRQGREKGRFGQLKVLPKMFGSKTKLLQMGGEMWTLRKRLGCEKPAMPLDQVHRRDFATKAEVDAVCRRRENKRSWKVMENEKHKNSKIPGFLVSKKP